MKDPSEALAAARRAASESTDVAEPEPASLEVQFVTARRLASWAIIEPDESRVYSTRRLGRPITALKRLLIRFVRQYLDQVVAQQSRFNAHVAAHLVLLEDRVKVLEQAAEERVAPERVTPEPGAPERDADGPQPR